MSQIRSTGVVKKAIIVDSKSMVVLDGVHRLTALRMLSPECVRVPAWLVDYSDEDVVVLSKGKSQITAEDVGQGGHPRPPVSSRRRRATW